MFGSRKLIFFKQNLYCDNSLIGQLNNSFLVLFWRNSQVPKSYFSWSITDSNLRQGNLNLFESLLIFGHWNLIKFSLYKLDWKLNKLLNVLSFILWFAWNGANIQIICQYILHNIKFSLPNPPFYAAQWRYVCKDSIGMSCS